MVLIKSLLRPCTENTVVHTSANDVSGNVDFARSRFKDPVEVSTSAGCLTGFSVSVKISVEVNYQQLLKCSITKC